MFACLYIQNDNGESKEENVLKQKKPTYITERWLSVCIFTWCDLSTIFLAVVQEKTKSTCSQASRPLQPVEEPGWNMIVDFAFIDFSCSSGCLLHLLYVEELNHSGGREETKDSNFIVASLLLLTDLFYQRTITMSAIHYCSFLPADWGFLKETSLLLCTLLVCVIALNLCLLRAARLKLECQWYLPRLEYCMRWQLSSVGVWCGLGHGNML